jgi:hypothetical protein
LKLLRALGLVGQDGVVSFQGLAYWAFFVLLALDGVTAFALVALGITVLSSAGKAVLNAWQANQDDVTRHAALAAQLEELKAKVDNKLLVDGLRRGR